MNDLFIKEQDIYPELQRCSMQVEQFRYQINQIVKTNQLTKGDTRKAQYFQQLFAYYEQDLIPALQETVRLGKKHIELTKKNPDKTFKPVKLEIKNHQKLIRQFLHRFDQIVKEFYIFCKSASCLLQIQ